MNAHVSLAESKYQLPSGEVLVDPTRPKGWGKRAAPVLKSKQKKFILNYIVQSSGNKRAMINGKKVVEGDFISGAKVLKIKQNTVTIKLDGRHKVLSLNKVSGIRKN